MRITLVGFGLSNRELFSRIRDIHEVFVSETRELSGEERELLSGVEFEETHSERLLDSDLIVVSPGVPPSSKVGKMVLSSHVRHTTEVGASFELLDLEYDHVVAVTGTNGKTTTSSMIAHALKRLGLSVFLGGNNETPLAKLDHAVDFIVLELSSFQLFWVDELTIDVGLILNVSHDHEDWHGSFESYLRSKLKLADFSKRLLIGEDLRDLVDARIFEMLAPEDLPGHLRSVQNLENVSATVAVLGEFGFAKDEVLEALGDFMVPAHRMEFVAEIGGVKFYDDSKATNVHAVLKAISNFDESEVVLILSGILKEEPQGLKGLLRRVKGFVVLGERMGRTLGVEYAKTMDEAVRMAFEKAEGSGVVLFSPGGASFDMFTDYAERGERFKEAVGRLNP